MKFNNFFFRCLIFLFFLTKANFAALPETFSMGPVMSASSGAGSASINDAFSLYYNVAGLTYPGETDSAQELKNLISLGIFYQISDFHIYTEKATKTSIYNMEKGQDVPSYPGQNIGAVLDLRDFFAIPRSLPVRWGIAVSLFSLSTDLAQLNIVSQESYNFLNAGRNIARPSIITGLSVMPIKNRLSLGIGTSVMVNGSADIKLDHISLDTAVQPQSETNIQIFLKPKPVFGIMYRQPMNSKMSLSGGISYRAKTQAQVDLDITAELPVIQPVVYAKIYDQELTYFTPHTIVWGWQFQFLQYIFMLDFETQLWQNFQPSITRQKFENDPGLNNIFIIRTGFETPLNFIFLKSLELSLRTGYAFVPSYTPSQNGPANHLDNDKHIVSFGFRRKFTNFLLLKKQITFSFSFQWQHWKKRNTYKTDYFPVSDGSAQPNYEYYGNIYAFQFGSEIQL